MTHSTVLAACLAIALTAVFAVAADDPLKVLPDKIDGKPLPEKMMAYLAGLRDEALDRRDKAYEKIKTPQDVHAWQKARREFFLAQLGPLPRRTPLNAKTVAKISRDGYRIEKVIYESQPKHYVTATLYLPPGKGPFPGVLVPCGHSGNGKASDLYQRVCILLATNGLVALCYDPIGQGERHQVLDAKGKGRFGPTSDHMVVSPGSILVGRNVATYRIWDGMRSIDYLAGRAEVDPKRIGCTGNSGGGTLTSFLMALDERITCAAPSCYLTTLRRLLQTIGPQDAEQCIHAQLAFGLDLPDYVILRAPAPTLLCTATRDFFDIQGSWDNFRQAKRVYMRLGHGERVDLAETDATHGFSKPLREAAVRWMRRWLLGKDDAIIEGDLAVLSDAEIQCTPEGETLRIEGARSVFDLNAELGRKLAARRVKFWKDTPARGALAAVRKLTGIRKPTELGKLSVEKVGQVRRKGYVIEKLILRVNENILLPALSFVPAKPSGQAWLYLHGQGKGADAGVGGPIEKLLARGHAVLAADLRGLGETARKKGAHGFGPLVGNEWVEASLAYMLGSSLVAMRAEDTLMLAGYLAGASGKPRPVHLVAVGQAGVSALHAAALEPRKFASVTIRRSLVSWSNVLAHKLTKNLYGRIIHGALACYDLPDLAATLGDKITIEEPTDARDQPCAAAP